MNKNRLVGAAASCLHDLAIRGDARRAVMALEQIAPEGFAELGILRLAHARAIDRSDHDALSSLAATFAGLGAGRLAVESAAEAAVGAARSGSTQAARRQAAEARRLADGCPGLATPSLSGAATLLAGATSPLTARERDVALRAAVGRSNRDIAEDLTMSERTVESHLARCYDKLGVRSRTELAGLLAIGGE